MKIVIQTTVSHGSEHVSRRGTFFKIGVISGLHDTAEEDCDTHKLFPSIVETIRELGYGFAVYKQQYMREKQDAKKIKERQQMPRDKHTPQVSALLARVAAAENMAKQYRQMYLDTKAKMYTGCESVEVSVH